MKESKINYLADILDKVTPTNIFLIGLVILLLIIIFIILITHRKFPQIIDRFINAKEFSVKVGLTSVEAKVSGQLDFELRSSERVIVEETINIIRGSGNILEVIILDQSKNGLRFSCTSNLKHKELVRIDTVAAIGKLPFPLPECLVIVRGVNSSNGNYVYDAKRSYKIQ